MSKQSGHPDHRDLYLLVIGLAAGLLLSQWCLGRFSPDFYEKWFVGGQKMRLAGDAEESAQRQKIEFRIVELADKRKKIEVLKSDSALDYFETAAKKELNDMAAFARRRLDHFEFEMEIAGAKIGDVPEVILVIRPIIELLGRCFRAIHSLCRDRRTSNLNWPTTQCKCT